MTLNRDSVLQGTVDRRHGPWTLAGTWATDAGNEAAEKIFVSIALSLLDELVGYIFFGI